MVIWQAKSTCDLNPFSVGYRPTLWEFLQPLTHLVSGGHSIMSANHPSFLSSFSKVHTHTLSTYLINKSCNSRSFLSCIIKGQRPQWAAKWHNGAAVEFLPYGYRVPGSILTAANICTEFEHSSGDHMGFLRMLRFSPTSQRHAGF